MMDFVAAANGVNLTALAEAAQAEIDRQVDYALKMMNFALKMVDFALNRVDFALKMMNFGRPRR